MTPGLEACCTAMKAVPEDPGSESGEMEEPRALDVGLAPWRLTLESCRHTMEMQMLFKES